MLVTRVQKLMHERNELQKQLNVAKTFVDIIDITLKLATVKYRLRQDYMIY